MHTQRFLGFLGFAATLALGIACLRVDAQDKEVAKPASVNAPSGTYAVDAVHSTVMFKIMHMGTSWSFGRFNSIEGSIQLADAPEKSSVEITLAADSVDTANADRDKHLKSPDFFDAAQFPKAAFKSKSVARKGNVFSVTGDLALHGVSQTVTIEMELTGAGKGMGGEQLVGFMGKLELKRGDFGIKTYPDALGEEVTLLISIEAAKK